MVYPPGKTAHAKSTRATQPPNEAAPEPTQTKVAASSDDEGLATRNAWLFGVSLAVGVSAVSGAAAAVYFTRKADAKNEAEKKAKDALRKGTLAAASSMTSIAVEQIPDVPNTRRHTGGNGEQNGQEQISRLYQPPSLEVV